DFVKLYHTSNKPTAADVGALTDAQAAQKYALRSYKVNGKPLSGDVNLLAGDVNAWNKSEADGRYLMKSGGQLTGIVKTSAEIQSLTADNYRLIGGDYGTFWRNDGKSLYLMVTNAKNQYGTFNGLRPF
ncbi:phage tail fiber protein, partial [Serratia proteamaculans]